MEDSVRLLCQIKAITAVTLCIKTKQNPAPFSRLFYHGMEQEQKEKEQKETGNQRRFGAAFDIGTTTVAGKLFDLDRQCPLAETTAWNPQGCFGADIITRMQYCMEQPDGLQHMQKK